MQNNDKKPDIGQVILVGFVILIFWMVWLALIDKVQHDAAAPLVQEQYYVVVPY